uniref:Odorant receptor n=1 Tax=Heliothis virescens TaxID=7102 RepID=Q6A1J5_HELVI|nr:putative chemosensory receptor 19 [Heliothis virescens]
MKDRDILFKYCKVMFYIGSGNCWYKEDEIGNDRSILYRVCSASLMLLYSYMAIFELIAFAFGNFPEEEKRQALIGGAGHTVMLLKALFLTTKKLPIRSLNRKIVSICEDYEDSALMARKYKIMKINAISYLGLVNGGVLLYIIEGLRNMLNGSHFVTVVTYYPSFEDDSMLATIVRVFNTIIFIMIMLTIVISVDTYIVTYFIMYRYKFITLRKYFENLRNDFFTLIERKEVELATEKLANGLVEGIKMHSSLIRLKPEIDKAFATVSAIRVFESSSLAVCLLFEISPSDQRIPIEETVKTMIFIFALFFAMGLFLCNAGDITYQASQLTDAIFYCGWQSCPPRPRSAPNHNIRKMVLLAIMQAQRPPVMKAFKVLELNYATYIQLVRSTYSVFTLLCAQKT